MNPVAREFLIRWALIALGVLVASQIVPGISAPEPTGLAVAALLLGLLNAFVRPLLTLIALPLVILTLGLFLWVINGALLYFVGWIVPSFRVASFGSALLGSAIISLVSWATSSVLGLRRSPPPPRGPRSDDPRTRGRNPPAGKGPIIDV